MEEMDIFFMAAAEGDLALGKRLGFNQAQR
jgi:hypothetical protein